MAPKTRGLSRRAAGIKRKRTVKRPAREPSPSLDSSSSSSTPNASPVEATSQVDHYASRVITTGRKFDFDLFEREGLLVGSQLKEMGFEKICSLDCPTYPALVKEFYRNLTRGDNGLISIVRGVGLNVSTVILSRLLDLPLSGPSTYDPEDRSPALTRLLNRNFEGFEEVSANQLPLDLRLLHNICSRILFPKTGRFDYVSERDIFVMDAVVSGRPINLPIMILWYMADCGSKRKSCLPYGMILTQLFRSQGIEINDSEPRRELRHTDYYSLATIHCMGFRKINENWIRRGQEDVRAEEVRVEVVRAEVEAGPSIAGPSVPGPSVASPSGPSTHSPPHGSSRDAEPAGFSDRQIDQIRMLLAEHESRVKDEMRLILAERDAELMGELKQVIEKLESATSRIFSSADLITVNLRSIFERLGSIADGSVRFTNATNQLRRDIDAAVDTIEHLFENFREKQRDEFMEAIGHLKGIVRKL